MAIVLALLSRLWSEDSGQGLVEYALIIALIALLVIAAILGLKNELLNVFNTITNCFANTASCPA